MAFKNPWVLFLIIYVVSFVVWRDLRKPAATARFPSLGLLKGLPVTWRARYSKLPEALRWAAVILLLTALAGPRVLLQEDPVHGQGVDIVLALDASPSMAAEDFQVGQKRVNRLAVVKKVVADFIDRRPHDRIGAVVFARTAYTLSPMTVNHDWLKSNLGRLEPGMLGDGTAIGSAIATSLIRLGKSKAKSRILILLTDGVNNSGSMDPKVAAQTAQDLGVKISAIGVGSRDYAPYPVKDMMGRTVYQRVLMDFDEALLQQIAFVTKGQYYSATDLKSLEMIYSEIDAFEKSDFEQKSRHDYREYFSWFLIAGLLIVFLDMFLRNSLFLKVP